MKSGATSHAERHSPPQRRGYPRAALLIAAATVGLAVVLVVMLDRDARRRPADEDAAPGNDGARHHAPSEAERLPGPRPALPQSVPAEPAAAEPRLVGLGAAEAARALTESKVQKYVFEAYPAWLRAHPGQECPHRLIELNEYMADKNANDAWGRPLRMFCGAARWAGKKRIEVISLGRDAQAGTEDDIKAEQ